MPSPPAPSRVVPSSPLRSPPPARRPALARSAASAASAWSAATAATSTPSFATCIGSMPRSSAAPATIGCTGTAASRTSIATPDARASSLRRRRRRRASRRAGSAGRARRRRAARRRPATAGACRTRSSAPRSNSPRASMIAVPWSPMRPETRIASPGPQRVGRQARARVAPAEAGRADVHAVGVTALDDLRVAGDDRHARRRGGARDRLDLGAQRLGVQALLEDQREAERQRLRSGHREVVRPCR